MKHNRNECQYFLSSGSQDGTVHLWTVQGKEPTDRSYEDASPIDQSDSSVGVEHVTSYHGHAAPITMLVFCESAVLLASGCKAGAVRVWDLWVRRGWGEGRWEGGGVREGRWEVGGSEDMRA